jgi:hypothetical protein
MDLGPPTSVTPEERGSTVTMEMLRQLQLQIDATQRLLQQQHLMFAQMQKTYMDQQQEQMRRMSQGMGM